MPNPEQSLNTRKTDLTRIRRVKQKIDDDSYEFEASKNNQTWVVNGPSMQRTAKTNRQLVLILYIEWALKQTV